MKELLENLDLVESLGQEKVMNFKQELNSS